MTFKGKTIAGVHYTLDHLNPFSFDLLHNENKYIVHVRFGCHCFTEKLTSAHTPDFHYTHESEKRAFCIERHSLSKGLPDIIKSLGNHTVYLTNQNNYFTLKQSTQSTPAGPYLVFFNAHKATKKGADVLINVESAYLKPGMADRASPIKFTTLVEKTALGQKVPRGQPVVIKRK